MPVPARPDPGERPARRGLPSHLRTAIRVAMFTSKPGRPSRVHLRPILLLAQGRTVGHLTLFCPGRHRPTALVSDCDRSSSADAGYDGSAHPAVFWWHAGERSRAPPVAPLPLGRAFRLSLIAAFSASAASTVGGGGCVSGCLRATPGWAKATHSVLLDRFVGVPRWRSWSSRACHGPCADQRPDWARFLLRSSGQSAGAAYLALGYLRWGWLQQ